MAEYINRAKVDYEFITTRGGGDTIINLYERILDIPTADVVECSKVNEAIEEAIKYRDDEKNDFCEIEVGAINGVLEIIKKNIGKAENDS